MLSIARTGVNQDMAVPAGIHRHWSRLILPASLPLRGMDKEKQSPITGVRVLVTGGTIDKIYDATGGTLGFERTQVLAMLRQSRVALQEDCVQHGHAHPQRAWERGLSMDSSGGYAAAVVVIALIFIASLLS